MQPLVDDMVQDDPSKRPTIDEVVQRYDKILLSLPWWKLHSRIVYVKDHAISNEMRRVAHFFRTIEHVVMFRNPLPRPRS